MELGSEKCTEKAAQLLSRRMHSTMELRRKLLLKGFNRPEIENTIARLSRLGFLDDAKFAESYARELAAKGFGTRKIRAELARRGLQGETMEAALNSIESESPGQMLEAAIGLLKRRMPAFLREDNLVKRKQKIFRFLASRGYPPDIISKALNASLDDL